MSRFRVAVTHGFRVPITTRSSSDQASAAVLDSGHCFRNCGEFQSEEFCGSRVRVGIQGAILKAQALADRLESEYA